MALTADDHRCIDDELFSDVGVRAATVQRRDARNPPPWVEYCRDTLARREAVTPALLERLRTLPLHDLPRRVDPRPAMARVALLAHRSLHPRSELPGSEPADLAEDLLLEALRDEQLEPLSWAALPSVKLPVLLVSDANGVGSGAASQTGFVAHLRLRLVPVGRRQDEANTFVRAPGSFLLQIEPRQASLEAEAMLRTFRYALLCAAAAIGRRLPAGHAKDTALVWDLHPPADCPLLEIGGNSAGAAFALAGLYLLRGEFAAGAEHAELRKHLRRIEWQRAAITAALRDHKGDGLTLIRGKGVKLAAWQDDPVEPLRPKRLFVAEDQLVGTHGDYLVPCKDLRGLAKAVAEHTGGETTDAQEALLVDLLRAAPPRGPTPTPQIDPKNSS